ncbi:MAG: pentapeptide repeat-containing protein, partial [Gemmatimonadetes bacterium]|nr:pentapeptide repeat-containing protein [Gemmatimonadota bacterium]
GGADLQYASLRGAELTRADLTGVRLTLAHLEGARLADATGLTPQQLESAYKDPATELPKHLD